MWQRREKSFDQTMRQVREKSFDQTTRQVCEKSFDQAFSKACAVEGAKPSSPSADGETLLTAFSFANFSFAPTASKEKWVMTFYVAMRPLSLGIRTQACALCVI